LVGAILLFLAAVGFVRKARAVSDPLLVWLACGANARRQEQRRLIAELHDGLAQELACVATADIEPLDVDLDLLIARLGREVEQEYGCRVVSDLERISVLPRTAHELGRVAREAMINAARHGHPDEILVHLDVQNGRVHLSVADDGAGIGAPHPGAEFSFGLTSMRQRAERLGGHCSIVSAPASGTKVAIDVPQR
jgi:signal transduction histidine kinase